MSLSIANFVSKNSSPLAQNLPNVTVEYGKFTYDRERYEKILKNPFGYELDQNDVITLEQLQMKEKNLLEQRKK